MATKIRLQRKGKKKAPYYHIVIADSRTKRDGKYIENIGSYYPITNPANIDVNFERALYWLGVGAQPTETVRAMLSYTGILMKKHLNGGVTKGALTQEQADAKFEKWQQEKQEKIQNKRNNIVKTKSDESKQRLAEETKKKEKKAQEVLVKTSALAEEVAIADKAPVVEETYVAETTQEETPEVMDVADEAKEDTATEKEEEIKE